MGLSSTPGSAVLRGPIKNSVHAESSGGKYVGRESEGGREGEGGGDVRAAGATAAAQAEPGREPVMQRGGAATWAIPTEDPCSQYVPHKGPHSSRTRMGKSTTSPAPLQLRKRPQSEKENPRGSSDTSLHKGGWSSRTSSTSITWEPSHNADSQPHLRPTEANPAIS